MTPEIVDETSTKLARNIGNCSRFDKLDHSIYSTRRQNSVWHQFEIQILVSKQSIHERKELDHQLILTQIVTILDNDGVSRAVIAEELEPQRKEIRFEDG